MTSENPFSHKSNGNTGKNYPNPLLHSCKITKGYDNLRSIYSWKRADSWKDQWGSWHFNFLYSPFFFFSSKLHIFETGSHRIIVAMKTSHWKGQNGFGTPQVFPSPEKCPFFGLSFSSLEKPYLQGLSLCDLTQCLLCGKSPRLKHLSKKFSGNCLTSQLPEVVIPTEANKSLAKKLKRKIWGMRCP